MGILRYALAVIVVIDHAGIRPWSIDSRVAVESFFLISGFYMALILSGKYATYRLFITNRLLRLFPLYLVVLGGIFYWYAVVRGGAGSLAFHAQYAPELPWPGYAMVWFANLFMIGQDLFYFLRLDPTSWSGFAFAPDFRVTDPQAWSFILIPQAWTLALELYFYALAPILVPMNRKGLVALLIGGLAIRWIPDLFGAHYDPWAYRFFPAELPFFLLGILSHDIYQRIKDREIDNRALLTVGAFIIAALTFNTVFGPEPVRRAIYFALLTVALPWIFNLTRNIAIDRAIGELSYPVYLIHLFVLYDLTPRLLQSVPWLGHPLATVLLSTLLAIACLVVVMQPVEWYRQRRVTKFRA